MRVENRFLILGTLALVASAVPVVATDGVDHGRTGHVIAAGLVMNATAQTLIDGILAKVGGDIVTMSDIRQARLLKLVTPTGDSDQAYIDAIINRRLMLVDLKRNPPPEPTTQAIDARQRQWAAHLDPGTTAADLLQRGGMTEAGLRGWLRDNLRLQSYLDERFGTASNRAAAIDAWVATLRQRAGIR